MKRYILLFNLFFLCLFTDLAYAGMPAMTLAYFAVMPISTISFFLLVFFFASFGVKIIWNFLRKDFQKLPKLSYLKALSLVFLWGLAFHLVLTMIAGTRELMTPGAWKKTGITYKLQTKVEDSKPAHGAGKSDGSKNTRE